MISQYLSIQRSKCLFLDLNENKIICSQKPLSSDSIRTLNLEPLLVISLSFINLSTSFNYYSRASDLNSISSIITLFWKKIISKNNNVSPIPVKMIVDHRIYYAINSDLINWISNHCKFEWSNPSDRKLTNITKNATLLPSMYSYNNEDKHFHEITSLDELNKNDDFHLYQYLIHISWNKPVYVLSNMESPVINDFNPFSPHLSIFFPSDKDKSTLPRLISNHSIRYLFGDEKVVPKCCEFLSKKSGQLIFSQHSVALTLLKILFKSYPSNLFKILSEKHGIKRKEINYFFSGLSPLKEEVLDEILLSLDLDYIDDKQIIEKDSVLDSNVDTSRIIVIPKNLNKKDIEWLFEYYGLRYSFREDGKENSFVIDFYEQKQNIEKKLTLIISEDAEPVLIVCDFNNYFFHNILLNSKRNEDNCIHEMTINKNQYDSLISIVNESTLGIEHYSSACRLLTKYYNDNFKNIHFISKQTHIDKEITDPYFYEEYYIHFRD
jgi:hypothetical protein